MRTEQRRDRQGHFIPLCKALVAGRYPDGCSTRAQYAIEGYGAAGSHWGTKPIFCKRHADAHCKAINSPRWGGRRGSYRVVKVER